MKSLKKKFLSILTSTGIIVALFSTLLALTPSSQTVSASSNCDKVNIVYCGLTGSDAASNIASMKEIYRSGNTGNGHTDGKFILNWGGWAPIINNLNTTNTKIGTLYRDGHIVVDGKTVATGTWLTARFTNGAGFEPIGNGIYKRLTTTSMMNASDQVLISFDANGKAVAGVVIRCGNTLRFNPVVPKPVRVCNPTDGTIISVPASEASKYENVNSPKCKDITVCRLSDKKMVTIKQAIYDRNTSAYSKDPEDCKPPVKVCNPETGSIITVPAKDKDKYLPVGSDKCVNIQVCVIADGTGAMITIKKDEFDSSIHSTSAADCKDVSVCRLSDKKIVTIKQSVLDANQSAYSSQASDCDTAAVIPSTGPMEILGGLFGSSALSYGGYSYFASRRTLKNSYK